MSQHSWSAHSCIEATVPVLAPSQYYLTTTEHQNARPEIRLQIRQKLTCSQATEQRRLSETCDVKYNVEVHQPITGARLRANTGVNILRSSTVARRYQLKHGRAPMLPCNVQRLPSPRRILPHRVACAPAGRHQFNPWFLASAFLPAVRCL